MLSEMMRMVSSYATIMLIVVVPAFVVFSLLPFAARVIRNR